jgi:carboxylesterase type B
VAFGATCVQPPESSSADSHIQGSEDCLTLNVYEPAVTDTKPLPVMVFIHGGANYMGSSSVKMLNQLFYTGQILAPEQRVVVVTMNYRLGALGFFVQPDGEKKGEFLSANFGLMDQIAALKWVQRNISKFSGDPSNVTVFGESAGSWNTCNLVNSPATKGLFRQAIMQSGACVEQPREAALKFSGLVKTSLGCTDITCMRQLSAAQIITAAVAQHEVFKEMGTPNASYYWPIISDEVKPVSNREVIEKKLGNDINVILGTNDKELLVPGQTAEEFTCRVYENAKLMTKNFKSNVYRYEFKKPTFGFVPSVHGVELLYIFDVLSRLRVSAPEDLAAGRQIRNYWGQMARTGSPSVAGQTTWLPMKVNQEYYLQIDNQNQMLVGSAVPLAVKCPGK